MQDHDRFVAMLRECERIVFFGGAGVSTESGVKDYRSEDGLYNTVKQYGVSPETILSHTFFFAHTDVFFDFYDKYFLSSTAQPNRAHKALADLEQRGKLSAVVTQNIDGLHQRAGSKRVFELHGTVLQNHCVSCGEAASFEQMKAAGGAIPRCPRCGGLLKPDVVLYEESLDDQTVSGAVNAIARADMLIIGGTSLSVYPAAGFVRYFKGKYLVLINRDATPMDEEANLVFHESIGEVLSSAVDAL